MEVYELTIDAKVLSAVHLQAGDAGAVCQICQSAIGPDEPCVACPQCEQVHHRECWSEIGGCAIPSVGAMARASASSAKPPNRSPRLLRDVTTTRG